MDQISAFWGEYCTGFPGGGLIVYAVERVDTEYSESPPYSQPR